MSTAKVISQGSDTFVTSQTQGTSNLPTVHIPVPKTSTFPLDVVPVQSNNKMPDAVSVFDTMASETDGKSSVYTPGFENIEGGVTSNDNTVDSFQNGTTSGTNVEISKTELANFMFHYERPEQWFDDIQEVFGDEFEFVENDDFFNDDDIESLAYEEGFGGCKGNSPKNKSFTEPMLFWRKSKQRKRSKVSVFVKTDRTEKLHLDTRGTFITLPIYTVKLSSRAMRKPRKKTIRAVRKRKATKVSRSVDIINTSKHIKKKSKKEKLITVLNVTDILAMENYLEWTKLRRRQRLKRHREKRRRAFKIRMGVVKKKCDFYAVRRRLALKAHRGASGKHRGRFAKANPTDCKSEAIPNLATFAL